MRKLLALLVVLGLLTVGIVAVSADGPTYTEVWDGRGKDSMKCYLMDDDLRPATGWIHWVFSTKGDSTGAELVLGGTGSGTYAPGEPLVAEVWHFYTPFFDLDGLTATIHLYGGAAGPGGGLVISDYCPGAYEELTVSKTADTFYIRKHLWDVIKSVNPPNIWLYADGSGDGVATWTVDVLYKGYLDGFFKVSGTITIKNTGTLDAVITAVDDVLAGTPIGVDCGVTFPYTLPVGETLTCGYTKEGKVTGKNVVTVTTERDAYSAEADLTWGAPTKEWYATVYVYDKSDLFGDKYLGQVSAPNSAKFTYTWPFTWADYGKDKCGDYTYHNKVRIRDGDKWIDYAEAELDVHVQCLVFKGETAWAANGNKPGELRYTQRGNWATYVKYTGPKTTTLFAAQTIPVGTVQFSAIDGSMVTITINLSGGWEFGNVMENLKVQDYATAPSGNPAPGLFAHKTTCDPAESTCSITVPANNFYGVHVNVGTWMPDPAFGP